MMAEKTTNKSNEEVEHKSVAMEHPKFQDDSRVMSAREQLVSKQNHARGGRLESEIPLADDYWTVRAQVQQELHKLENQ